MGFTLVGGPHRDGDHLITAVVLLDQRIVIVQGMQARARDKRTSWVLATQKSGGAGARQDALGRAGQFRNNGDFSEVDPEYGVFAWEYQIVREEIQTADPCDVPKDKNEFREARACFA